MEVSINQGFLFRGSCNKDHIAFRCIQGEPMIGPPLHRVPLKVV